MNRTKVLSIVLGIALFASLGGIFSTYTKTSDLSATLRDRQKQAEGLTRETDLLIQENNSLQEEIDSLFVYETDDFIMTFPKGTTLQTETRERDVAIGAVPEGQVLHLKAGDTFSFTPKTETGRQMELRYSVIRRDGHYESLKRVQFRNISINTYVQDNPDAFDSTAYYTITEMQLLELIAERYGQDYIFSADKLPKEVRFDLVYLADPSKIGHYELILSIAPEISPSTFELIALPDPIPESSTVFRNTPVLLALRQDGQQLRKAATTVNTLLGGTPIYPQPREHQQDFLLYYMGSELERQIQKVYPHLFSVVYSPDGGKSPMETLESILADESLSMEEKHEKIMGFDFSAVISDSFLPTDFEQNPEALQNASVRIRLSADTVSPEDIAAIRAIAAKTAAIDEANVGILIAAPDYNSWVSK